MILALILLAAPTGGRDLESARLVKAATALYDAGKYDDAAERLLEAYTLQPNPTLLYNIGRSYERGGKPQKAAKFYRRCAQDQTASPKLRDDAERALSALSARLPAEEEKAPVEAAPPVEAPPVVKPPAETPTVTPVVSPPPVLEPRPSFVPGVVLVGGGLVVGAAAATLGVLAVNHVNALPQTRVLAEKQQGLAQAQGEALASDLCTGVAVAATVVGVVLLVRAGLARGQAVAVWAAPQANGLAVGARW